MAYGQILESQENEIGCVRLRSRITKIARLNLQKELNISNVYCSMITSALFLVPDEEKNEFFNVG